MDKFGDDWIDAAAVITAENAGWDISAIGRNY